MRNYKVNFRGRVVSRRREYRVKKMKKSLVAMSLISHLMSLALVFVMIESGLLIYFIGLAVFILVVLILAYSGYLDVFLLKLSKMIAPHYEKPKYK